MRASKVGLFGLVGGAALYALRRSGVGRGQGGGGEESAPRATQHPVSTASRSGQASQAWPDAAASFDLDPEGVLADREEQADHPVDASADSSGLVAAERDALTVPGEPGEEHRRRDQTAGGAAQEIAAAQVRSRRSGGGEDEDDYS